MYFAQTKSWMGTQFTPAALPAPTRIPTYGCLYWLTISYAPSDPRSPHMTAVCVLAHAAFNAGLSIYLGRPPPLQDAAPSAPRFVNEGRTAPTRPADGASASDIRPSMANASAPTPRGSSRHLTSRAQARLLPGGRKAGGSGSSKG